MNKTSKIIIVLALAAVVAAVLIKKNLGSNAATPAVPAQAPSAATGPAITAPAQAADSAAEAEKSLPTLIDLGADKCVPCKMMAPILEELRKTYAGKLEVEFIDVWKNSEAAKLYGVQVIPTQIFQDANGNELFRHQGFFSREDILAKWKELGINL